MEIKRKSFDGLSNYELYGILKLRAEVFVVEQESIYNDLDGRDQASIHFFAMDHNEVAGCVRLMPRGVRFDDASVGRIVMKKEYRGTGLAVELIQAAIDFATGVWKEKKIMISAQSHLQKFYGRFGFETISEEYMEDGIPHVEMLLQR